MALLCQLFMVIIFSVQIWIWVRVITLMRYYMKFVFSDDFVFSIKLNIKQHFKCDAHEKSSVVMSGISGIDTLISKSIITWNVYSIAINIYVHKKLVVSMSAVKLFKVYFKIWQQIFLISAMAEARYGQLSKIICWHKNHTWELQLIFIFKSNPSYFVTC